MGIDNTPKVLKVKGHYIRHFWKASAVAAGWAFVPLPVRCSLICSRPWHHNVYSSPHTTADSNRWMWAALAHWKSTGMKFVITISITILEELWTGFSFLLFFPKLGWGVWLLQISFQDTKLVEFIPTILMHLCGIYPYNPDEILKIVWRSSVITFFSALSSGTDCCRIRVQWPANQALWNKVLRRLWHLLPGNLGLLLGFPMPLLWR